jgi:glutamate decarboxylase
MFNCACRFPSRLLVCERSLTLAVLNLGFAGYRRIMQHNLSKARLLSRALENSGYFTLLSNIHRPKPLQSGAVPVISNAASQLAKGHTPFNEEDAEYYYEGLPVVSFRFTDEIKENYPELKQAWMQEQLRAIGWIVPK